MNEACGMRDRPGVYQRIAPIHDWIQQVIDNDGQIGLIYQLKQSLSSWIASAVDNFSKRMVKSIVTGLGQI